jgi:hypothetical protein
MAQSIPINPSFGKPKSPWDAGGKDRGPIFSPPDIGEIGGPSKSKFACRRKAGNQVMKVGKR